jgi:hypothetical protein
MKLRSAFLANHAEVRESLAFVSGAFPEYWRTPALNAPQIVAFVANLEFEESEIGKTFNFLLGLQPPQGAPIGLAYFNSQMDNNQTGEPRYFIAALNLTVAFSTVGVYNFTLSTTDESGVNEIAKVPLNVILIENNPQTASS